MVLAARYRPLLLIGALALLMVAIEWQITHLPQFYQQPTLPAAVSADLLLGLPTLFYLGIVRRYRLSLLTLVAAFGAAVAVAAWVLPPQEQQYVQWGRKLLLLTEPLFFLVAILKIGRIVQVYRESQRTGERDFMANLSTSLAAVLGLPGRLLAAELQMLRYALFFWLPPAPETTAALSFTQDKRSAFRAIIWTLLLVSGVEMLSVHLLLVRWQPAAAWVALALSAYSALFLLAHLQAVAHQPTVLADKQIRIRVGCVWQVDMMVADVQQVYLLPPAARLRPDTLNLARLLFTEPNVLLACCRPTAVTGAYGWQRTAQRLAFYVDDPAGFVAAVQAQLLPIE